MNLVNPENVFESARRVVEADDPVVTQTPFTEKHPAVRLIPFAKVEEAVAEVTFRRLVCIPPINVEEAVEVATNLVAVRVSVKVPAPVTESAVPGVEVPIPIVPAIKLPVDVADDVISPPENVRRVDVAALGKGYAKVAKFPGLKHVPLIA